MTRMNNEVLNKPLPEKGAVSYEKSKNFPIANRQIANASVRSAVKHLDPRTVRMDQHVDLC